MSLREHIARTLALGVPLTGSLVAQMLIQLTDTVMLGRYDITVLAGQVLGSTLFTMALLFGAGFGLAVTPLVAEADSRGRTADIRRVARMAMWLAAGWSAVAIPVFLLARPIFLALGQSGVVSDIGAEYLAVQGWSIFPAMGVMVLRGYLSGLGRARAQFWAMAAAVVVNAAVNYALIFGNWGAPELGVVGAAVGSLLSTLAACAALGVHAAVATREHALFVRIWRPDPDAMGRVFRLGWPIGLAILAEAGLFSASSVMVGWLGEVPLAAHGIAIQIISIVFMAHMGLSQAATIRAGNALGRNDRTGLARGAQVAMGLSACIVAVTVTLFLTLPEALVGPFLRADDPDRAEVLALGVAFLAAAALFQAVDAAQVMAMGGLRGVQDTRGPMVIASVSYWLVGIPAAWVLGFGLEFGGVGVWLGMAVGLFLAAVLLQVRFWRMVQSNGSAG